MSDTHEPSNPTADAFARMSKVVDEAGGDPERPRTRRQLLKIAGAAVVGGAGLAVVGGAGLPDPAGAATGDVLNVGDFGATDSTDAIGVALGLAGNAFNDGTTITTGTDIKLDGTGRLTQLPAPGTGSGHAPTYAPYFHNATSTVFGDLVRGSGHEVWASTGLSTWKRLNAVRVDNPNGTGNPFTPFRLIDTRPAFQVGPLAGPFGNGAILTIDVNGSANIPNDCIAIFGNLTAVFPNYSGWLTIFPASLGSAPNVSNVNFDTSAVAFPNSVFVGLSGGNCKVYLGGSAGTTSFILDIFGYVQ